MRNYMRSYMRSYRTSAMVGVGILCSVGLYIYIHKRNTINLVEDLEPPYENRYPLGLSIEEVQNNETEENRINGVVEEETPKGKVILKYSEDENAFQYWSDNTQDYKYLEVSARKYVILFDCKDKYINIFRELVKSIEKHNAAEKEKEKNSGRKDSVFATFKSYESSNGPAKLANENANIYKCMGKLNDWRAVCKNHVPNQDQEQKRKLSYLEYKQKY